MKRITIDTQESIIALHQLLSDHDALDSDCTLMVCEKVSIIITVPDNFIYAHSITLLLAPHASVYWVWPHVQADDSQSVRMITIQAAVGAQCELHLFSELRAGTLSDSITVSVNGRGSRIFVHAARMVRGNAHAALSVRHIHQAPETVSCVKVRDVLSDSAKANFYGHAWMKEGVIGSDGMQDHKAILLSESARCQVHPEIQVCTDQVSCAHGSAIGRLPKELLAYAWARGLNRLEAQSLLLHAFISELVPTGGPAIVSNAYASYIAEGVI